MSLHSETLPGVNSASLNLARISTRLVSKIAFPDAWSFTDHQMFRLQSCGTSHLFQLSSLYFSWF